MSSSLRSSLYQGRAKEEKTMSIEADVSKSIRVIPFSGNEKDWRMWSRKFLAISTVRKFRTVLLGQKSVPKYNEKLDPNVDVGKLKAREANDDSYSLLMLCCDD